MANDSILDNRDNHEEAFDRLLHLLTVDCKDDGRVFVQQERLTVIKSLLAGSDYLLRREGDLSLLYAKRNMDAESEQVLISSHVDCVYGNCFVKDQSDCWLGTFDNSATNAALIELMLTGRLADQVLIAFTGDEEKDSKGAVEVMHVLQQEQLLLNRAVILDVTNEGWEEDVSYSMENDWGFDLLTGFRLVSDLQEAGIPCVFVHHAEPDESWEYRKAAQYGLQEFPCLSLCVPVSGDMHADAGVLLRKSSIPLYQQVLEMLANALY